MESSTMLPLDAPTIQALRHAGFLLGYPKSQSQALRHAQALAEDSGNQQLQDFADWLSSLDDGKIDEAFANTFEIGAQACLYAGFHIFGLAYKRGILLVTLKAALEEAGVENSTGELSDHLSLVLVLAAAFMGSPDPDGKGEALIEELVMPVIERLCETFEPKGYGLLIRGLDEWLKTRWTPCVWQLVEEDNDAHFLA